MGAQPANSPLNRVPVPVAADAVRGLERNLIQYTDTAGRAMRRIDGFPLATEIIVVEEATFNKMQFPEADRAHVVMTVLGLERMTAKPFGFTGKMTFGEALRISVDLKRMALSIPLELR